MIAKQNKKQGRRSPRLGALLAMAVMLLVCSACHKMTPDEVADIVLTSERERAPLIVQQMVVVEDITMDSIRISVQNFPMEGMLYTTWTVDGTQTPVIVQVRNIHESKEHRNYLEWETDWPSAAKAFLLRQIL